MRVDADKLTEKMTIAIAGTEPWLAGIYKSFPTPAGKEAPQLTANVRLWREASGFVEVRGELQFSPYVDCSRCNDPIAWPLDLTFEATFREVPAAMQDSKELNLERGDLDQYYFSDGHFVDVEELLNDQIQIAIPMRTVRTGPEDDGCLLCGKPGDEGEIYKSEDSGTHNPFAVLGKLRQDH